MIISDEQARLAAQYLRTAPADTHSTVRKDVSADLLSAVYETIQECPECRADRVREATARLGSGALDSHEVAEKMISRILSDALR